MAPRWSQLRVPLRRPHRGDQEAPARPALDQGPGLASSVSTWQVDLKKPFWQCTEEGQPARALERWQEQIKGSPPAAPGHSYQAMVFNVVPKSQMEV